MSSRFIQESVKQCRFHALHRFPPDFTGPCITIRWNYSFSKIIQGLCVKKKRKVVFLVQPFTALTKCLEPPLLDKNRLRCQDGPNRCYGLLHFAWSALWQAQNNLDFRKNNSNATISAASKEPGVLDELRQLHVTTKSVKRA